MFQYRQVLVSVGDSSYFLMSTLQAGGVDVAHVGPPGISGERGAR